MGPARAPVDKNDDRLGSDGGIAGCLVAAVLILSVAAFLLFAVVRAELDQTDTRELAGGVAASALLIVAIIVIWATIRGSARTGKRQPNRDDE